MCDTCGCSNPDEKFVLTKPGEERKHHHHHDHEHHQHDHEHAHHHHHEDGHEHSHSHSHSHSKTIEIQQDVLVKNNLLAERNRGYFEAKNIKAYNLVSSPGSGKTSLLEKTIEALKGEINFYVIEGDQQSSNDANRIHATGAPAIQINTGNGCHLDSEMVNSAMKELDIAPESILMIENVGNLVCPSLFDLGESKRIVIISTTEGEDKPLKYPYMFESSHLCIINKMDLVPYLDIDVEKIKQYAMQVNHHLEFLEISVKTGDGMDKWFEWLKTNNQ